MTAGPEYQKLQVSAMADAAELPKPATSASDGHALAKLSYGALVSDALSYASRVRFTCRVQRMVC